MYKMVHGPINCKINMCHIVGNQIIKGKNGNKQFNYPSIVKSMENLFHLAKYSIGLRSQ